MGKAPARTQWIVVGLLLGGALIMTLGLLFPSLLGDTEAGRKANLAGGLAGPASRNETPLSSEEEKEGAGENSAQGKEPVEELPPYGDRDLPHDQAIRGRITDKEKKLKGVDFFLVERDTPGFTVGKDIQKLGLRGTETAELAFEDCRIPGENRLGEEGTGYDSLMGILAEIRVMTGALALGLGRSALDMAVQYANERVQFGRPIAKFQLIQEMVADMVSETDAARLLTYRAFCALDGGESARRESSIAKAYATEAAVRVTSKAIQIHGGYGYLGDYHVERFHRCAKITEIYEGTTEIQKLTIMRYLLKRM